MVSPECRSAFDRNNLRQLLYRRAGCYSALEDVRLMIVEAMISAVVNDPDRLFNVDIDKALFAVLHDVAVRVLSSRNVNVDALTQLAPAAE